MNISRWRWQLYVLEASNMDIQLFPNQVVFQSLPDRRKVLIVDDDDLVRDTLRFVLEGNDYIVLSASRASEALAILETQPVDIIISDIFMPGMNGFELLKQINARCPNIPVILVTGFGNIEMARHALKEGASDFITKPYNIHEIPILIERNLTRHTIENRRTQNLQDEIQKTYRATMEALLAALDTRDTETEGHSERVAAYTMMMAQRLSLSQEELTSIERGALLHDIGKIGVPDSILYKPGALDEEEWQIMKQHPVIGYRMCMKVGLLQPAAPIVLHHHERWDGKGYPYGLSNEEIPLGARLFAIADTLDAITSDRPYRQAKSFSEACEEIVSNAETQFDPDLVKIFLEIDENEWEIVRRVTMEGREVREAA
jgi:putative two-component system response regulator